MECIDYLDSEESAYKKPQTWYRTFNNITKEKMTTKLEEIKFKTYFTKSKAKEVAKISTILDEQIEKLDEELTEKNKVNARLEHAIEE